MEPDFIDAVLGEWALTYPDIDTEPVEVVGRIARISALMLHDLDRALVPAGISRAEFEVLGALARSGEALRASEVTSLTMVSGAATTKHADRLVKLGLLERCRWEPDGRVVLLEITAAGRALVDAEFPARVDRDSRLLHGLDEQERHTLIRLLRQVTANAEAAARR
ncbi:MarR family winged helix-turn-helix transcriptional regulator [Tomitella biformata]|uniref:MarR family winged helix-turn-helix transcriptional regulator n=1 Tax=Tomitella biformata TaxID=630403 RepID=UPI000463A569|nr:MarR family transcriptional regulator [Tomitella biformata]